MKFVIKIANDTWSVKLTSTPNRSSPIISMHTLRMAQLRVGPELERTAVPRLGSINATLLSIGDSHFR